MIGAAILTCALILPTFLDATLLVARPSANFKLKYELDASDATNSSLSYCDSYRYTCEKIARSVSSKSQVFYSGSRGFEADIAHWTNLSSQTSACSVEPGTPQDVGLILQQLASTHTPFAVKDGGHTLNPGFSSTRGVQISMARFNDIVIHEDSDTVEIGSGLTWMEVYSYIVPKGINVVGGRSGPVGVSGYTLGGGYSFKTNQYGLAVDTVTEYELVLPTGEVKIVTAEDEDLWFALKVVFGLRLFYDGPELPDGLYNELLNLPSLSKSITKGSFAPFISSLFLPTFEKQVRSYFDGVPLLQTTEAMLDAFANETKFWGERLSELDENVLIVYTLEPFEPDYLTHGGPSAYPPDRSYAVLPSNIYYGWSNELADEFTADAMRSSAASLMASGIRDGQNLEKVSTYPNYALFETPLEKMYGAHLERLREIRKKYDPNDVMYLTGGWKF
ncbi:hypothetical protein EI94DRAFT_1815307 [Lactarius quietus]|nr:hypothetical protein EI94DRAFT_1815307 [Lactarius quietus]